MTLLSFKFPTMQNLPILGQVLLGLFFVLSGVNHFKNLKGSAGYAASKNVPMPETAVAVSGAVLIFGGLSILSGRYLEFGIWGLIVFLILASVMFHNFWADKDAQSKMMNKIQFMKNTALIGALLMLLSLVRDWPYSL